MTSRRETTLLVGANIIKNHSIQKAKNLALLRNTAPASKIKTMDTADNSVGNSHNVFAIWKS